MNLSDYPQNSGTNREISVPPIPAGYDYLPRKYKPEIALNEKQRESLKKLKIERKDLIN